MAESRCARTLAGTVVSVRISSSHFILCMVAVVVVVVAVVVFEIIERRIKERRNP